MVQNHTNYQRLKKENKKFEINERDIKSGKEREERERHRERDI